MTAVLVAVFVAVFVIVVFTGLTLFHTNTAAITPRRDVPRYVGTDEPTSDTKDAAERAYATADAKRRERFTQRYQSKLAQEGISPALAAEEARRIYADLNSLGVT